MDSRWIGGEAIIFGDLHRVFSYSLFRAHCLPPLVMHMICTQICTKSMDTVKKPKWLKKVSTDLYVASIYLLDRYLTRTPHPRQTLHLCSDHHDSLAACLCTPHRAQSRPLMSRQVPSPHPEVCRFRTSDQSSIPADRRMKSHFPHWSTEVALFPHWLIDKPLCARSVGDGGIQVMVWEDRGNSEYRMI